MDKHNQLKPNRKALQGWRLCVVVRPYVLMNEGRQMVNGLPTFWNDGSEFLPTMPHSFADFQGDVDSSVTCLFCEANGIVAQQFVFTDLKENGRPTSQIGI